MVMAGTGEVPGLPNFMLYHHLYVSSQGHGLIWTPYKVFPGHPGRFVFIEFDNIETSLYIDLLRRGNERESGCTVLYTDLFRHLSDSQIRSNLWYPPEPYCIYGERRGKIGM